MSQNAALKQTEAIQSDNWNINFNLLIKSNNVLIQCSLAGIV